MSCPGTTVQEWITNDCTLSVTGDQLRPVFQQFYGDHVGLYLPEEGATDETINYQSLLGDVCNVPGNGAVCAQLWTERCQGYTRSDTNNPIIGNFCGCYLPSQQYNLTGQRSCDPICANNNLNGVKYYNDSGDQVICNTNICLIDNITVNEIGSQVDQITFSQLCSVCDTPGSCRCIISDINILSQDSRLGQSNLIQNCGTQTECFIRNSGGNLQSVPCQQYNSSFSQGSGENSNTRYALTAVVALTIVVLVGIGYSQSRKRR